jgi:4-hydroxybenzoate-CoA ligase
MEHAVFDEGPFEPCPASFNMAAHTFAAGARDPDRIALEVLAAPGEVAESWTYGALIAAVRAVAGGLEAAGIGRGDRVLLRIGNSSSFPLVFFGANALGAVPVPTSPMLADSEVARIVEDLEPAAIVADGPTRLQAPIVLGPSELAALPKHSGRGFARTRPDDPAFIVYTSGTGGRPKGVVHGQRAAWARRMMWRDWYGLTADDRVLHAGAFNWTYTLGAGLTDPWAAGATALIHVGAPDRHVWPKLAAAHGPTIFAAVPGVYRQMLSSPNLAEGFAALRHGLSAGEALAPSIRSAWEAATGRPIYEALLPRLFRRVEAPVGARRSARVRARVLCWSTACWRSTAGGSGPPHPPACSPGFLAGSTATPRLICGDQSSSSGRPTSPDFSFSIASCSMSW